MIAVMFGGEGISLVQQNLLIFRDIDEIRIVLGDDDLCLMVSGHSLHLGIDNLEDVAILHHRPALVGHKLFGTFTIFGADFVQQVKSHLGLSGQSAQGNRCGNTHHTATAWNADAHGKLDDMSAQFGIHLLRFLPQDITRLGTRQGHHLRLVAADGRFHLLAEQLEYFLDIVT